MVDLGTAPVTRIRGPGVGVASGLRGARRGVWGDRLFAASVRASAAVVLLILAGVVWSTSSYAWPTLADQGWSYLTSTTWSSAQGRYGALALVYGTVVSSALAVCIAVPVSVGVALFITEVVPPRLRGVVVALVDLLAAIPSVVFGLVGLLVLHDPLQRAYQWVAGPSANGSSIFTAGLVVAVMIVPIITSISREVIATVPRADRDAALALGSTRWEMLCAAVLPRSFGGITGAAMLGLGRALGETVAVALVIGSSVQLTANLFQPGYSMAAIIANTFNGEGNIVNQQALMGLGVVLFVITVVVNMAARVVVARVDRRRGGAS